MRLGHRDWHVVTQAKVEGKLVVDLPVVSAEEGKILDAPSVDLGNVNIRIGGCAAIEAGEAKAGVGVSRSAGGTLVKVNWPALPVRMPRLNCAARNSPPNRKL